MASLNYVIGDKVFTAPPLEPALYVVATPIGNLRDITLRALETLAASQVIYCEDTRVTAKLLERYSIRKPLKPCHEHNESALASTIVAEVRAGSAIAFASDAGTPLISDPGFKLVEACHQHGVKVIGLPGASAVLMALQLSGLATHSFSFHGFPPQKQGQRQAFLRELKALSSTLVLFESPNRIIETLADLVAVMGDRQVAVARELTKIHEEALRGSASEVLKTLTSRATVKGECVLVVAGAAKVHGLDDAALARIIADAAHAFAPSKAAAQVAKLTGLSRDEAFARILALKAHG